MPYVEMTGENTKERYLISGLQGYGKTYSSMTFLFGKHDFFTHPEQALEHAGSKSMVVLACPGEFGTRKSLEYYIKNVPRSTLRVIGYEPTEREAAKSLLWSNDAIAGFNAKLGELVKNPPNILFIDGVHALWDHIMNRVSEGVFLEGGDLQLQADGKINQYRSAALYDRAHNTFGQYIARLYDSPIPLVVATVWEDWKAQKSDASKAGAIGDERYLWCDVPGKMATRIIGKFDGRLSATLYNKCLHDDCKDSAAKPPREHYVWQFYPRGEVKGVSLKGLRLTQEMKDTPYIHQNYEDLKELMEVFK